jgi:hypothetical protein
MSLKESVKQLQKKEHISQDELFSRLGCSRSSVMDTQTIEAKTAFELAFGNINDCESGNNTKRSKELEKLLPWVRKFPIRALQKMGHIPSNIKDADLVRAVFRFMNIGGIAGFEKYYSTALQSANPQTYAAWIRLGEFQVERKATDFTPDQEAILANLKFLRKNTFLHWQSIRKTASTTLKACGIEYIEVEPFLTAPTPVCAFYWRGSRPVIQFPTTKMDDSKFLEALFHAVGHLILHPKHTSCLQLGALSQSAKASEMFAARPEEILELEANRFAQDMLLSEAEECELICCGRFNERRCIQHFSGQFHVRPGILVERLQQQGKLNRRSPLNEFKVAV